MVRVSLATVTLAALTACGANRESPRKPYRAEVLGISSVPVETAAPRFTVEARTFSSLRDIEGLSGDFVVLRTGGELSIKSMAGSVIVGNKFTGGAAPRLRYTVRSGTVVPSDYSSLAMLSAYFQFDTIFSRLEDTIGISPQTLASAQPGKRYEVLFEPRIVTETDSSSGSMAMKRNAAFIPGQGQFVLFERSVAEQVPLGCNLQVLAHEFGHALFDYTFFKNRFDQADRYLKMESISGLNEGFADFFSFLITGSTDVLSASLGSNAFSRERNFGTADFTLASLQMACSGGFYCLGTLLAKSLYSTYKTLGEADATALRRSLPTAFSAARDALDAADSPADEVNLLLFLESLSGSVAAAASEARVPFCQAIKQNFSLEFGPAATCRGI